MIGGEPWVKVLMPLNIRNISLISYPNMPTSDAIVSSMLKLYLPLKSFVASSSVLPVRLYTVINFFLSHTSRISKF